MHASEQTNSPIEKDLLARIVLQRGFAAVNFLQIRRDESAEAFGRSSHADPALLPLLLNAGSVMMTALPFGAESAKPAGQNDGMIAPFARSFHYREAVKRLQTVVREICDVSPHRKQDFRIFCNSRFPEKSMAALCGLGFLGKNGLLIHPVFGSRWVLAGVILPFEVTGDSPIAPTPPEYLRCGTCTKCIDACPTHAIELDTHLDSPINRDLCLSDISGRHVTLSNAAAESLENRLYGCSVCQDVCPYNSDVQPQPPVQRGAIGPAMDVREILEAGIEGVNSLELLFAGTVLGQNYLNPLVFVRNALCIAGNNGLADLRPLINRYLNHEDDAVSRAAEYAIEKIGAREY